MYPSFSQNQGVKPLLFRSLELFVIDETPVGLRCFHHVHCQILVSHWVRPFHLDEKVHMATNFVANVRSEGLISSGLVLHSLTVFS